jgi:hypothetical protein
MFFASPSARLLQLEELGLIIIASSQLRDRIPGLNHNLNFETLALRKNMLHVA